MVGGFVSYFEPAAVLCTAISTLVMFLGLTVQAMLMSNDDMHILAGLLVSLLLVFFPVLIFCLLFPSLFIFMIVQGLCVVLTSIYIIFDTRLIMTKMSFDDYIIASLMLYIDIINLFMYMLAIFGSLASS